MADDGMIAGALRKPALGRRERKKQETRANILMAAKTLFLDKGYYQTTVEDIAEMADISKPTLFNYFTSKSALLSDMALEIEHSFIYELDEIRAEFSGTGDRLIAFYEHAGELMAENRDFAKAMLVEALSSIVKPDAPQHHRMDHLRSGIRTLLADGIMRGDVRKDCDLTLMVQLIISMFNSTLMNWLADESYPLQENLRAAAQFVADSISSPSAK
jgi:AcrR family transcriptional regulator